MDNNFILKRKKILFLGGPALMCDVVKTAKSMGLETIVTDWYPVEKSPAKKIADKYFMISTSDVDGVVKLIKNESIDGVLTGFTDSTLQYYQQICNKAGLPCYLTENQINITTNKLKFKELCKKFGVPVVEEYSINSFPINDQQLKIKYPVIVKPIDNSGGRGISICRNDIELEEGYKKALSFSESKKVLIESYMDCKEATIFYVFHNGEIHLTLMGNRHIKHNQKGVIPLPVAYTFPSKYLPLYQKELNDNVRDMFKFIGMKNGMVFIQTFIEDGRCIFYEMGYRLTGTLEYKIIEKISGINPLSMMILFSLTGNMSYSINNVNFFPNHSQYACNITFLVKPGKIREINGIEKILSFPEVIDAVPSYKEGDTVPISAIGTLKQVVLRVFACTNTKNELDAVIEKIHNKLEVISENGKNMLLEKFNVKELYNDIE